MFFQWKITKGNFYHRKKKELAEIVIHLHNKKERVFSFFLSCSTGKLIAVRIAHILDFLQGRYNAREELTSDELYESVLQENVWSILYQA